ncbi:MAG: 1,2-phenylacetyl-CoA epoxidase subunit B [Bacteroidetes bacterium]|nr:1,2-phenylacetyl-CoA epoxidase subunit B [Bacteroidota bacterium]
MENSLDPRINRLSLIKNDGSFALEKGENWHTYEVFHLKKRGDHHKHVGSLHAPTPEIALVFAKEQFGRRQKCVNLWVVPSREVYTFNMEDEDMFATASSPEKKYRDASGFKVRDKIAEYKKTHAG